MRRAFLPSLKAQMKAFREEKLPEENSAANCNGLALVCRLMLGLSAMESHARAPATATVIVRQENPFGGLSATMENHCVAFVLTDDGDVGPGPEDVVGRTQQLRADEHGQQAADEQGPVPPGPPRRRWP